ncbi:WXG100 family type VII secretion target [Nonomuraea sp. SBT364]|uniref:WXG100 family type VII secretion target n=1 Tax=Nonomuraea sp. SBT364 TaxID=1580530 RepID=UPI00066D1440|nr:hypothetical protein [Nonomuraea sp. SBT364]
MAEYQSDIKADFSTEDFEGATLEMLRESLNKNKPNLLREAATEFFTAKERLDNLVGVLDRHLRALEESWTDSADSRVVKTSLRRLRESAADVSRTISAHPPELCPVNPSGVAPALNMQAATLDRYRGEHIPDDPNNPSILERGVQGGQLGLKFGGPQGGIIGTGGGLVYGLGETLFGESEQEKNMKKAKKHLRQLTLETATNNNVFPQSLRTEIPQFETIAPDVPITPFNQAKLPGGLPSGMAQPFDPSGLGPDGLNGPGQDGLFDPGKHQIPGLGDGFPGSSLPGGSVPGGPGFPGDGSGGFPGDGSGYPGGPGLPGSGQNPGSATTNAGLPNGPQLPGSGTDNPTTSLAGLGDPNLPGYPNSTNGLPSTGYPNGQSGGIGSAYGAAAGQSAASTAGLRGMGGGSPMVPMIPPAGAATGQDRQERERTTYLLGDEDDFRSDVATTNHLIDGKGKAKA